MSDSLAKFCTACHAALAKAPGPEGRRQATTLLEGSLADPDFLAACFPAKDSGRRELYRDPELGFCLLAYDMADARVSPPHNHGVSWAIYGQVSAHTDMTEYERLEATQGPGPAHLKKRSAYRLAPGQAAFYDVGVIHSIDYPANTRFLRITGQDLEVTPRLKFDLEKSEAVEISSATMPG